MKIPFFGNDRQYQNLQEDIEKVARDTWKTGQYLNGPAIEEFERNIATFSQRKYALAVGSCTDALTYALRSLKLDEGSEVLVTNFSFLSSATSILRAGLIPIFCDVCPQTMMVNRQTLEAKVSKKTKVVLAVSLFGSIAAMDEIGDFCHEKNLTLIEDAAQSFGAQRSDGKMAGSFGLISATSFDPTKLLHGTGAGGVLLTDQEELYQYAKSTRLHGRDEEGNFIHLGDKSLISTHDGAILNLKLSHLQRWIDRRQNIAKRYIEALESLKGVEPQFISKDIKSTFHKFVIRCENSTLRDHLKSYLNQAQIVTRIHYGKLISEENLFSAYQARTPIASQLTQTVLTLPLFQELTDQEVDYLCETLRKFQTP